jgi:DNA-binding NtrC family response regulator
VAARFSTDKLRILLVEDHADTRAVLKAMLESLGHHVEAVATLREGRKCLRSSIMDGVFSDMRLPDGMGWKLLKGLTFPPPFFAVAMSGHLDSFHDEIKQAGFCCRIDKPVSLHDIENALKCPRCPTTPAAE